MLLLAAIIYSGTWSTTQTQSHGVYPQGRAGSIVTTQVRVDRQFPEPVKGNAVRNLLRAQESKRRDQEKCAKLHRMDNSPAPQQNLRCGPDQPDQPPA